MTIRKKIVVTGGAGFIGSALANLLSVDYEVVAIDNLSSGDWSRLASSVDRRELDIATADLDDLKSVLEGAEYLCHLAAVKLHNLDNSADRVIDTNIVGTKRVLEAAGQVGVKRVLFTSSLYSYGSVGPAIMNEGDLPAPTTIYGASKLIGEQIMKNAEIRYGFSSICARLFFIYGPGQYAHGGYKSVIVKTCERLLSQLPALINGDGKQSLDYVYIDDCTNALALLLLSEFNGVYNVSSGESVSIAHLVKTIGGFEKCSTIEFAEPDWTANTNRFGDNTKLKADLGWRQKVPLADGLKMTWEYYSERKAK